MRADGTVVTCRVAKIDAPEVAHWQNKSPGQPYGKEATKVFESLLGDMNIDASIKDPPKGKMRNGEEINYSRKLCLLAKDGKSLNLELVKQGAAWADHYKGGDKTFIEAEAIAHAKKLGLHITGDAEYPAEYRKKYPSTNK